jgi:CubicO group peptidase (beta-lactamase class C family)
MSGLRSARVDAFIDRFRHHWKILGIALAVVGKGKLVRVHA